MSSIKNFRKYLQGNLVDHLNKVQAVIESLNYNNVDKVKRNVSARLNLIERIILKFLDDIEKQPEIMQINPRIFKRMISSFFADVDNLKKIRASIENIEQENLKDEEIIEAFKENILKRVVDVQNQFASAEKGLRDLDEDELKILSSVNFIKNKAEKMLKEVKKAIKSSNAEQLRNRKEKILEILDVVRKKLGGVLAAKGLFKSTKRGIKITHDNITELMQEIKYTNPKEWMDSKSALESFKEKIIKEIEHIQILIKIINDALREEVTA